MSKIGTNGKDHETPPRAREFLSQGFEALAERIDPTNDNNDHAQQFHFDTVVIGSGYGGAIAAASLAGAKPQRTIDEQCPDEGRLCVLERGREYLPGSFPSRECDLAGHVRFATANSDSPKGIREGLFDFKLGPDINALVANGLGGGSLINAGVMEEPLAEVFNNAQWPQEITKDALARAYEDVKKRLGVVGDNGNHNTVTADLAKRNVVRELGAKNAKDVAISVALNDRDSAFGVALKQCVNCGDCATGCNFGAKESLDVNLLVEASERGAKLYTGATVLRLEPLGDSLGWTVHVNHTDLDLRKRQGAPLSLRARRVVLAAGTFGSTEILMRSKDENRFPISDRLGHRFSGNGDAIAVLSGLDKEINGVANEVDAPAHRNIGPTITSMIDHRAGKSDDFVIEELASPGALRRLWEQTFALARTIDDLKLGDFTEQPRSEGDPASIDPRWTKSSLAVAIMGHDDAGGRIQMVGDDHPLHGDGAVHVVWPTANTDHRLERAHAKLKELLECSTLGGRMLANPFWRPAPPELATILGSRRGPLVTVHPLGGCAMGADVEHGVVNHLGQVFKGPMRATDPIDALENDSEADGYVKAASEIYENLVVLDGSIIPGSLAINPALSICALALRAVETLRDDFWNLCQEDVESKSVTRPEFKQVNPSARQESNHPTTIQLVERMDGEITLDRQSYRAEITIESKPTKVLDLTSSLSEKRKIEIDPERSKLRLFESAKWPSPKSSVSKLSPGERPPADFFASYNDCPDLNDLVVFIAPLSGSLEIFAQEPSPGNIRIARGFSAWLFNRGVREIIQWGAHYLSQHVSCFFSRWIPWVAVQAPISSMELRLRERMKYLFRIASTAGEVRLINYDLELGKISKCTNEALRDSGGCNLTDAKIQGSKRITYGCRTNPLRQLMAIDAKFINNAGTALADATLNVDLNHFARQRLPLLKIVEQANHATALIDLATFLGYVFRILLRVHLFSFRLPDDQAERIPRRLPGPLCGIPKPDIVELNVAQTETGAPVMIRLTRYLGKLPLRPVLMIHGYSASGTTFAHPAVKPNLAQYLHERGFDIWILDLRSSMGMPTARENWTFEQIGYGDIPPAVEHICRITSDSKIDIVAHCMGSAMLLMALLGDSKVAYDPYAALRRDLAKRINRLVISQVPLQIQFSAANTFRAYVLRYAIQYLGLDKYNFNPPPEDSTFNDELLDRLLAVLPYPEEEFRTENPFISIRGTPWTRTRHRMDALYGRAFSANNLSSEVRRCIDDFFGPLNIDTVSQVINFAAKHHLTDERGFQRQFRESARIKSRLGNIDILSIHGTENGLIDASSAVRMTELMYGLDLKNYRAEFIDDFGHQDCLIGKRAAEKVFPKIGDFLA